MPGGRELVDCGETKVSRAFGISSVVIGCHWLQLLCLESVVRRVSSIPAQHNSGAAGTDNHDFPLWQMKIL